MSEQNMAMRMLSEDEIDLCSGAGLVGGLVSGAFGLTKGVATIAELNDAAELLNIVEEDQLVQAIERL